MRLTRMILLPVLTFAALLLAPLTLRTAFAAGGPAEASQTAMAAAVSPDRTIILSVRMVAGRPTYQIQYGDNGTDLPPIIVPPSRLGLRFRDRHGLDEGFRLAAFETACVPPRGVAVGNRRAGATAPSLVEAGRLSTALTPRPGTLPFLICQGTMTVFLHSMRLTAAIG
ncbi:MAG: hypothetical protein ACFB6R_06245 [Alphaproteobacteria bacterium]